ncbi:response regulator [Betaproteobacteria bacterium]|nr:response regulator [Betaproteobacteria bacterium]GHT95337.1 response regulator [Betaproteobacteria bacterium]GHU02698.1 response regulator [Betaproteobacteria bacterium]GHU08894.1 response regulator [Betaproteobacteria bacterium]GHU20363.1 response regulator [Betaproteobacteria bacterium]
MADSSFAGLRVLLVEPSAMQAELISRMLSQMGVENLQHFKNAGDALAEMGSRRPDVVISSLYLPDMSGTDLVTAMRHDPTLEWLPFILISSETRPQVLDPIRQSGACCIIAKPFTPTQMARALTIVVEEIITPPTQIDEVEVENLHVLLVDDSLFSRRHTRRLLEDMGVEHVTEAENGRQAVTILADAMVDLVITDYNMPEMDGKALIEYIRTKSWQTEVPIMMITSENDQGRLAAVEKAGVSAICDKPFEAGGIRQVIVNAVRG